MMHAAFVQREAVPAMSGGTVYHVFASLRDPQYSIQFGNLHEPVRLCKNACLPCMSVDANLYSLRADLR